jgi:hypothetical protein
VSRLDIGALNEYSRKFADLLFASHPEWKTFAQAVTDPKIQQTFLQVEVPAPPESDFNNCLYILTEDDEITIGVRDIHWHVDEYQEALDDVEKILTEEIVLVLVGKSGSYIGGGHARRSALPTPSAALLDNIISFWSPSHKTEVRIRSWRGSLNTVFCVVRPTLYSSTQMKLRS